MKKKLLQIVDSVQYVSTNCYQHQLLHTLSQNFDHQVVEINSLSKIPNDVIVFCSVKIQNVFSHIKLLKNVIGDHKVFVYDQDPWESFIDTGAYKGKYAIVAESLKNSEFINTSKWWTDHVLSKGYKSNFCRMWTLPEYCSYGIDFSRRDDSLYFRGQLHSFRKACNDALAKKGVTVKHLPGVQFDEYIRWLQTVKSSLHDESDTWAIDGVQHKKQCAVPKDVEIMSQGTFVFRDSGAAQELHAYNVDECPLLITYDTLDDVRDALENVRTLDATHANSLIKKSVEFIKDTNGWLDFVKLFQGC